MIQDIKPNIYRNEYSCQQIKDNDTVVFVNSDCVLIKEGEKLEYPGLWHFIFRNIIKNLLFKPFSAYFFVKFYVLVCTCL